MNRRNGLSSTGMWPYNCWRNVGGICESIQVRTQESPNNITDTESRRPYNHIVPLSDLDGVQGVTNKHTIDLKQSLQAGVHSLTQGAHKAPK